MPEERDGVSKVWRKYHLSNAIEEISNSYKFKELKKSTEPILKSYISSTTPMLTPLPSQVFTDIRYPVCIIVRHFVKLVQ